MLRRCHDCGGNYDFIDPAAIADPGRKCPNCTVHNLDGMAEGELRLLSQTHHYYLYRQYGAKKLLAMAFRREGQIEEALAWERECEEIWGRMAPEWKW